MNTMRYKGYVASVSFDDRDNILVGRLLGIRDVVGFHADNVAEFRAAFEQSVEDYLDACRQLGQAPDKPASGKMMLRVNPAVHAAALQSAKLAGKSLNQWAADVFVDAAFDGQ